MEVKLFYQSDKTLLTRIRRFLNYFLEENPANHQHCYVPVISAQKHRN